MKPGLRIIVAFILTANLAGCCHSGSHYDSSTGLVHGGGCGKGECRFFLFRWVEDVFDAVFFDSFKCGHKYGGSHSCGPVACRGGFQTMPNHTNCGCGGHGQMMPGTFGNCGGCAGYQGYGSTMPAPMTYAPMQIQQQSTQSDASTTNIVPAPPAEAKQIAPTGPGFDQRAPLPGQNTKTFDRVERLKWVPRRF